MTEPAQPTTVYVNLITTIDGQGPVEVGIWQVTAEQADMLSPVLNVLHSHPDRLPATVGPRFDPAIAQKILDGLEQTYHDRVCKCRGWPTTCQMFAVIHGQISPGARFIMPHSWSAAEVLTEWTKQVRQVSTS